MRINLCFLSRTPLICFNQFHVLYVYKHTRYVRSFLCFSWQKLISKNGKVLSHHNNSIWVERMYWASYRARIEQKEQDTTSGTSYTVTLDQYLLYNHRRWLWDVLASKLCLYIIKVKWNTTVCMCVSRHPHTQQIPPFSRRDAQVSFIY